jgi:hypothetical protein
MILFKDLPTAVRKKVGLLGGIQSVLTKDRKWTLRYSKTNDLLIATSINRDPRHPDLRMLDLRMFKVSVKEVKKFKGEMKIGTYMASEKRRRRP